MIRLFILLAMLLAAVPGLAQEKPAARRPGAIKKDASKKEADKNKKAVAVTPEREAAVNEFVEQHHPELAELLKHLKGKKNVRQYERAIRDLYAVSERLAGLKQADSQRYEPELKAWKLKSRIQLLSARLTMGDNEELRQELKQALAQQYDVRRELLSMEKQRLSNRLQKIEQDLSEYDARRDAALEKQFQRLTSARPKARPGAAKKKTTTSDQ